MPQRFYVTQQRMLGGRHLYALRTRFIPDTLMPKFNVVAASAEGQQEAKSPGPAAAAPTMDLQAALRLGFAQWGVAS